MYPHQFTANIIGRYIMPKIEETRPVIPENFSLLPSNQLIANETISTGTKTPSLFTLFIKWSNQDEL